MQARVYLTIYFSQQHHIRELERANAQLKDKLMVAKQQILATSGLRGGQNKRNLPRGVAHPMQMNRQAPEQDLLSPGLILASNYKAIMYESRLSRWIWKFM